MWRGALTSINVQRSDFGDNKDCLTLTLSKSIENREEIYFSSPRKKLGTHTTLTENRNERAGEYKATDKVCCSHSPYCSFRLRSCQLSWPADEKALVILRHTKTVFAENTKRVFPEKVLKRATR